MNVSTSGVKGYEYQYKVSVLLALALPNISKLYIEKVGSEDATIIIEENSSSKTLEIQVKRENNLINIQKLVSWLNHFQERSNDNNLLSRLTDNNSIRALIVTHSRCSDETVKLKNDTPDISSHQNLTIDKLWNDKFLLALENSEFKNSQTVLGKERYSFNKKQKNFFKDIKSTIDVLKRVIIWEEAPDETIDNLIETLLNKKNKIPQSQYENVYLLLLEAVRKGRDKSVDILPFFKQIVENNIGGKPLLASNYLSREGEEKLIQQLEKSSLLLLTGISFSGKSELAKHVAKHFFDKGYNFRIFDSINELNYFLSLSPLEDKIAILEDPWGNLSTNEQSINNWQRVLQVTANLHPNHKLVITSRIEIINELKPLGKSKIQNHEWFDVTEKNRDTLIRFWKAFADGNSLPLHLMEVVSTAIAADPVEDLLQIGQLQLLANTPLIELLNKNIDELKHIARQNSSELALSIKAKGEIFVEVLSILTLGATTIDGISIEELGFIFSSDEKEYSISSSIGWSSIIGKEEKVPFPKYNSPFKLSKEIQQALSYFEERRFISIKENKIYFTHPNYWETGRHLFFSNSSIKQNLFLKNYKRTLCCISSRTTFLASKQFNFVFNAIESSFKKNIFELALYGLDSIFPAVKDNCLIFLINHIDQLDEDDKENVTSRLDFEDTPSNHIFWSIDKIPFISKDASIGLLDRFFELSIEEEENIVNKFKTSQHVDSYDAWNYIKTIRNKHKKLESAIALQLLAYDEVFIRKSTSFLVLLQKLDDSDIQLVSKIFSDEHPSVIFNAIRASLISWVWNKEEIKNKLFDFMKTALQNQAVAVRANQFFTTFATEYKSEALPWENFDEEQKKELWDVWGKVFPIVLKNLPSNVFLHTPRFGVTMDESLKYLTLEAGMNVLSAWYERIDFRIKLGDVLDEYELAIADNLLEFTKDNYKIRKVLFTKLVTYNDTNFIISSLKWALNHWKELHISEKEEIIKLINSDRKDVRWIKAVLLNTYNNPPSEIQKEIFGSEDLFEQDTEAVLKNFPEQLLQDCLNVYCGHPQPLWWLAVHHHNVEFWSKIIRFILINLIDPYFNICLRHLLSNGVNGFSSDWSDGREVWEQVCSNIKNKKILTERLIYDTSRCSCNITTVSKLWATLIRAYQSDGKYEEIVKLVSENIELLQQTGYKEDIVEMFDLKFLEDVFKLLFPDFLIVQTLETYSKVPMSEFSENETRVLEALINHDKSIRIYFTPDLIKKRIDKVKMTEQLKNKLLTIPNMIDAIGKEKQKDIDAKEYYKLSDWIGIN
jgi:hypothetical protein